MFCPRFLYASFVFQPTLPARGATCGKSSKWTMARYFNPRSPHGERPRGLREERRNSIFQPTLPARGATLAIVHLLLFPQISTHAPRTGSDRLVVRIGRSSAPFQPTLPARGATGNRRIVRQARQYFNPRSPHGERLREGAERRCNKVISTHAPRTGSDLFLLIAT